MEKMDGNIWLEFTEEEMDRILEYQETLPGGTTMQEAVLKAISVAMEA